MSSEDIIELDETNGAIANDKVSGETDSKKSSVNGDVVPSTSKSDEKNGDEGAVIIEIVEPPAKKPRTENADRIPSPVPDDPDVKAVADKKDEEKKSEVKNGEKKEVDEKKKEPELTNAAALLDKLQEYIDEALEKQVKVERKVLDALLAAINIQVQKEPLSVRKLILEKQLVLPNTISQPPSQVVDLLIEHDPEFPLAKVISKMFGDERIKVTETEKREKHILKQSFGAPHMTKLLMEIGQDLVQEATYCDIVHARNLPEVPKNLESYKQVAAQLKPVWETLKKKNEPYKLKLLTCQVANCGFKTESRMVLLRHRSQPHFDGKVYRCGMCPEFDTNEQRLLNHYIEAHEVIPNKEDPPLRNPCYICEEDFQLKGQREAHYKMCKRDFQKLRHIMGPKSPEDICIINRWLWEKPPIDGNILQQQQTQQAQHQKQQRAALAAAQAASVAANAAAMQRNQLQAAMRTPNLQQQVNPAAMQQSFIMHQRMKQLAAAQQGSSARAGSSPQGRPEQNSLIAAMQKHIQQSFARTHAQSARGQQQAASPQQNMAALLQQQRSLQQQAATLAAAKAISNGRSTQMRSGVAGAAALPLGAGALICEICDQQSSDREKYFYHLQVTHKQMKGKSLTEMHQGAPLACSRCRDRFWTYEGLERHLVMSHGLVTQDLLQKAQKKEDGGRCKLCSKQYAFNMLQHLVADHSVKLCSAEIMYSCDVCSFKCQSYQKLEHHLSTSHPKKTECITLDD